MSILDQLGEYGGHIVTVVVASTMAIWATLDVVQRKRDTRAQIGWVGLIWFSPVLGAILYFMFGINRVSRRVATLEYGATWQRAADLPIDSSEQTAIRDFSERHAQIADLAFAIGNITGRSLYPGNAITILHDGDEAYPAMLEAILRAEQTINLCSYIFNFDEVGQKFTDELLAAQRRGVAVRVLIDAVGARYGRPNVISELRKRGIKVAAFLPSKLGRGHYTNLRNHKKILVVDGKIAFTGGTNISKGHWLAMQPSFPIRCLHFRIEGPVVRHLQEVFAVDWAFAYGESLRSELHFPQLVRKGRTWARGISDGPDADLDKLSTALFCAINAAKESVIIVTPYFLPETPLILALNAAVLRGVDVRIVVPKRNNIRLVQWATLATVPRLLDYGVQLALSSAPFDHTKLMVVDDLWSLVGSTNWDPRSLRLNFEFNVECYDPHLGRQLGQIARGRFDDATKWTCADAVSLPRWAKIRNGIVRLMSPYL